MQCGHCHSIMDQSRKEHSDLSEQAWYQCTMCGRLAMQSLPLHRTARPSDVHEVIADPAEADVAVLQ